MRARRKLEDRPAGPRAAAALEEPGEVRLGQLQDYVGFHLRLAQNAAFHAFVRRIGRLDLGPGRFAFLSLIGENPGISQTALGRANGRDKSTLTPVLDDLVRRGLVRRERLARDRRSYSLSLTGAGEEMLAELTRHAEEHEAVIDRLIGSEEKTAFLDALRRLIGGLAPGNGAEGADAED